MVAILPRPPSARTWWRSGRATRLPPLRNDKTHPHASSPFPGCRSLKAGRARNKARSEHRNGAAGEPRRRTANRRSCRPKPARSRYCPSRFPGAGVTPWWSCWATPLPAVAELLSAADDGGADGGAGERLGDLRRGSGGVSVRPDARRRAVRRTRRRGRGLLLNAQVAGGLEVTANVRRRGTAGERLIDRFERD